jgi:hypothetical protein
MSIDVWILRYCGYEELFQYFYEKCFDSSMSSELALKIVKNADRALIYEVSIWGNHVCVTSQTSSKMRRVEFFSLGINLLTE